MRFSGRPVSGSGPASNRYSHACRPYRAIQPLADKAYEQLAPGGGPVIIPQVLIDDEDQRLAIGPFSYGPMTWTAPAGTFDEPGRYLVICTFRFHFVDANMYAWVVVK